MSGKEKAAQNKNAPSSLSEKALIRDLKLAGNPDLNRPFADVKDACTRLLPFHVFSDHQPEYWRAYSQAVARASLLISLEAQVQPKPDVECYDTVEWLERDAGWSSGTGAGKWEEVGRDKESLAKLLKAEAEEAQRREERTVRLKRKVKEAWGVVESLMRKRDHGGYRGEETVMIDQWLLGDEKVLVAEAQQREARAVAAAVAAAAAAAALASVAKAQDGAGSKPGDQRAVENPGDTGPPQDKLASDLLAQFGGQGQIDPGLEIGLMNPPMSEKDLVDLNLDVGNLGGLDALPDPGAVPVDLLGGQGAGAGGQSSKDDWLGGGL